MGGPAARRASCRTWWTWRAPCGARSGSLSTRRARAARWPACSASSLNRHGCEVEPFIFTQATKSALGWDFLGAIESGRWKDYADDGATDTRRFWAQVEATRYDVAPGPGKLMRWAVPAGRGHDDLIVSAALIAALDRRDWRPRVARGRTRTDFAIRGQPCRLHRDRRPVDLLASAARTADADSPTQDNSAGYSGLILLLNFTAGGGFGHGVWPVLQGWDELSGQWYDLYGQPGTFLHAAGLYNFEVYPGVAQPAWVAAGVGRGRGAAAAGRLARARLRDGPDELHL